MYFVPFIELIHPIDSFGPTEFRFRATEAQKFVDYCQFLKFTEKC